MLIFYFLIVVFFFLFFGKIGTIKEFMESDDGHTALTRSDFQDMLNNRWGLLKKLNKDICVEKIFYSLAYL
jgi:hypothetical protein